MNATMKLLVAIDGSEDSLRALDWGCRYAAMAGCDVEALHVWGYPYPGLRTGVSEPYEAMELEAAQVLHDQVKRYLDGDHPSVTVHPRLAQGSLPDVLLEESKGADLLVVGRRGRSGLAATLLGSVSRAVAEHAACPVVVVHPGDVTDR